MTEILQKEVVYRVFREGVSRQTATKKKLPVPEKDWKPCNLHIERERERWGVETTYVLKACEFVISPAGFIQEYFLHTQALSCFAVVTIPRGLCVQHMEKYQRCNCPNK